MQLTQSQSRYQIHQLTSLLEDLQRQQVSGTLHFTANLGTAASTRSRLIILSKGEIVYGGASIPDNETFVKTLGKKLDRSLIDTAMGFALSKLTDRNSVRELLEMMVRLRVIKWQEIETLVGDLVVQTIEQLLPYPGQYRLEEAATFDLTLAEPARGLDWSRLRQEIDRRQQIWQSFAPLIPSMDAIPQLREDGLARVTDISVRQQLQQQVDGKKSLVEIAEQFERDPLELGKSYLMWLKAGWITCKSVVPPDNQTGTQAHGQGADVSTPKGTSTAIAGEKRPLILSVDDSMIVQTTIKRILADRYEVMLANNAIAALNILNANQVDLMLLDVTMPDIDGLEFCKTLRDIPKFKSLPIVMVTAKDSLVDKFKGFMAGSNQYLYKPIEAAHLLEVVGKLIQS